LFHYIYLLSVLWVPLPYLYLLLFCMPRLVHTLPGFCFFFLPFTTHGTSPPRCTRTCCTTALRSTLPSPKTLPLFGATGVTLFPVHLPGESHPSTRYNSLFYCGSLGSPHRQKRKNTFPLAPVPDALLTHALFTSCTLPNLRSVVGRGVILLLFARTRFSRVLYHHLTLAAAHYACTFITCRTLCTRARRCHTVARRRAHRATRSSPTDCVPGRLRALPRLLRFTPFSPTTLPAATLAPLVYTRFATCMVYAFSGLRVIPAHH